jgi:histidinol dehydrogenase
MTETFEAAKQDPLTTLPDYQIPPFALTMPRNYLKQATGPTKAVNGSAADVSGIVRGVIDSIRVEGDAAVRQYSEKFDKWSPESFKLSDAEIQHAISQVPAQAIADIKEVQANVRAFAVAQRASLKDFEIETAPGVFLGQRNNPINCIGA